MKSQCSSEVLYCAHKCRMFFETPCIVDQGGRLRDIDMRTGYDGRDWWSWI